MNAETKTPEYPARLEIDYPEKLDRLTSFLRLVWIIPILIVFSLISGSGQTITRTVFLDEAGEVVKRTQDSAGGIAAGLALATALMIVFQQRYPRWWFDFARELTRFGARVGAYLALLTDQYPSTVDEQSVHLEVDYPDAKKDLNRWYPLFKWLFAIPHYFVLAFLFVAAIFVVLMAWFAILFTGKYPRGLFDFIVGVGRWNLRVSAYTLLLVTDRYPPFSLRAAA
jgi:hypothetical protein